MQKREKTGGKLIIFLVPKSLLFKAEPRAPGLVFLATGIQILVNTQWKLVFHSPTVCGIQFAARVYNPTS